MTTSTSRKYPQLVSEETRRPSVDSGAGRHASEPPTDSRYLAGDVIADRYRLVRKLGEGGMGVVWVAHSLVLGVDIALKLIRANVARPGDASRMAREAQAAARLGHPALVRVFDFGWTTRGDPFLVMELAQGETLSKLLRREARLGAIRAVQLLLPIADGLRCAHEKGIIHRDIKPENVFLAADPFGRLQPKLLDFGIAKVDQPSGNRLTQVGAVLGSPEFMSPEQAKGADNIDARADVWSMCVMLYELISGTLPFQNSNYNALMQAILNDMPTPTTEHGAGDAALWRVIARGLEKEPDARWESMTELGEALALWLYEHGVKEDISGNSVRALWLDGMLSGVKSEVDTESPPPHEALTEPPPSNRATEITTPPGSPLWLRMRQWRVQLSRRWRPLALAGAGMAGGVLVTLVLARGPAESARAPAHKEVVAAAIRAAPKGNQKGASTNPHVDALTATKVLERAKLEPKAAADPSGANQADPAGSAATKAETASVPKKTAKHKPRYRWRAPQKTKSINDFGF